MQELQLKFKEHARTRSRIQGACKNPQRSARTPGTIQVLECSLNSAAGSCMLLEFGCGFLHAP